MAESSHVFINGNNLDQRFKQPQKQTFVIGECGFGFGLNFLVTLKCFSQAAEAGSRLHFISSELHPVQKADLERYYLTLPSAFDTYASMFLAQYSGLCAGVNRFVFEINGKHIILDLLLGDALTLFGEIVQPRPLIEAWYLDGFAPNKNTTMWSLALFKRLAGLSKSNATLSTYSVAGDIRRNLEQAGFKTEKISGFGKKRHMLTATFSPAPAKLSLASWANPWNDITIDDPNRTKTIAIIGAGLAGCSTAYSLATRGYAVTLIDQEETVACGASGNPRGLVHFKSSLQFTPVSIFRLHAYLHALRHYSALSQNKDFDWQPNDVLQVALTAREQKYQKTLLDKAQYDPEVIDQTANGILSALAGLKYFGAGSLDPVALCQSWSNHDLIELLPSHELLNCHFQNDQWHLELKKRKSKKINLRFDALIFCTNKKIDNLHGIPDYPLIYNHGQTDTYAVKNMGIKSAITHKGYLIPWKQNGQSMLTIGGSFKQGTSSSLSSAQLCKKNLSLIRPLSENLYSSLERIKPTMSRLGVRCTTTDFMPLIGPVENKLATEKLFKGLKRNARKEIKTNASYIESLYINIGHGSHGLTTTPLAAEYLASLISGESLPVGKKEITAIHPLRYLIRDLKKQK